MRELFFAKNVEAYEQKYFQILGDVQKNYCVGQYCCMVTYGHVCFYLHGVSYI